MSIRKRKWTTAKGEAKEAWIVDYTDQAGARHIETFERKKDADARHDAVRQDVRQGVHISTKLTVGEAGENWIAKAEKGVGREGPLERATIKGYREVLRLHIAPLIGKTPIAKLDAEAVNKFEGKLLDAKKSKATIKTVLSALSMILADAGAPRNVVRDRPRYKRSSRHQKKLKMGVDIPHPKEVSAILHHAPDRWRPLLVVAAFTGLRASELRGLHWEDVDLKKGVITVSRRADRYNEMGSPKSKTSRRKVPFGPVVANALRPEYVKAGGKGIAFPTRAGTIAEHSNLVKASIIPAAEAAGVPQYTGLHCLRHFYASWCLNRKEDGGLGYSFQQVKELMGHSSITITVDRYGHLFENGDPNTLEAAETALMGLHATQARHAG
jgi:integrase